MFPFLAVTVRLLPTPIFSKFKSPPLESSETFPRNGQGRNVDCLVRRLDCEPGQKFARHRQLYLAVFRRGLRSDIVRPALVRLKLHRQFAALGEGYFVLLSDKLTEPTVENLWNYLRHFFAQVGEERRGDFAFEDMAGIYEADGKTRLFAVCTRYSQIENLLTLPAGKYLCAECTEETRAAVREELLARAREKGAEPQYIVHIVVLTGILQWKYELQVRLGE